MFHYLTNFMSFGTLIVSLIPMTTEQKKRLLKAKIAVALQDELGRVPKQGEIEQVNLLSRVMYKAILGLHSGGPTPVPVPDLPCLLAIDQYGESVGRILQELRMHRSPSGQSFPESLRVLGFKL
jgi:hypothetical protein